MLVFLFLFCFFCGVLFFFLFLFRSSSTPPKQVSEECEPVFGPTLCPFLIGSYKYRERIYLHHDMKNHPIRIIYSCSPPCFLFKTTKKLLSFFLPIITARAPPIDKMVKPIVIPHYDLSIFQLRYILGCRMAIPTYPQVLNYSQRTSLWCTD